MARVNPEILIPGYSRREALVIFSKGGAGLGLTLVVPACDFGTPLTPQESREFRTSVGQWSREEVMVAARAMMSDSRLENIIYAGKLLLENQQGKPVISQEGNLFSNDRIQIETVETLGVDPASGSIPMDVYIKQIPPIFIGTFKARKTEDGLAIRTGTGLQLEKIRVSRSGMASRPEFLFKLFLAKEIYNIRAFELVTTTAAQEAALYYNIPSDSLTQRALKTHLFTQRTADGVSVTTIADLLAHFFVLPDYNLAKDLGVLEGKANQSWVLDTATELLKEQGVLYRDSDGRYKWREGKEPLTQILIKTAWAGAKSIFKPSGDDLEPKPWLTIPKTTY